MANSNDVLKDTTAYSVPVLVLKPFHNVPRFSVGFITSPVLPPPTRKGKEETSLVSVYLPLFQNILSVPSSFLKIYKQGTFSDVVKVPIETLTLDHLNSLNKPIMYTIKAPHKYHSISKTTLHDLLTVLFNVFSYISVGSSARSSKENTQKIISKISIMNLKMILPVLANYIDGIYLTICMRPLENFKHQDQLLLFAVKKGSNTSLFDGGPLPLLSQKTEQIDLKGLASFVNELPIYTIKGDIICAE